jgi:hypothetical protein
MQKKPARKYKNSSLPSFQNKEDFTAAKGDKYG